MKTITAIFGLAVLASCAAVPALAQQLPFKLQWDDAVMRQPKGTPVYVVAIPQAVNGEWGYLLPANMTWFPMEAFATCTDWINEKA